ncbi:PilZ domain-containing protein [Simiduia sp. 21SJ11W-1]|uniref:PilZ domain-containing protein n=1 Tax=Simiduia sp. 21SJ11W-1 TaxID=2909669 RepID=UPI0020A1FF1C|nr:PilZ domain-containing protein [Simiduia sp. 21SJ11W-1]UTA47493.1 PilZ domain-containing protein [Simiduia sp. 21SJ11W-1]
MTSNQRKLKRHDIAEPLDIWDAQTDEHLGRLVNIHAEGLMMIGKVELAEDKLYQLRLTLPQNLASTGELALGVDCLWVRSAEAGEDGAAGFWAGCQIIDASPKALDIIALLVARLAAK